MFDFVLHRSKLSKARKLLIKIPLLWEIYKFLNKFIFTLQRVFPFSFKKSEILDFGFKVPPTLSNPQSQLCTSNQFYEKDYDFWIKKLNSAKRFSRKQWEFIYIAQILNLKNKLKPGCKGIGFGCGKEPLPGLFSEFGVKVIASDLSVKESKNLGWARTEQHASKIEDLYKTSSFKLNFEDFKNYVGFEEINMNKIPEKHFDKYDFVWSSCSLEHLGSIDHGINFIINSLKCLKEGGVSVHTTEFNLSSLERTLNETDCCIFRLKDLEKLKNKLPNGYEFLPLNLNTGSNRIDSYVDHPPFNINPHLKVKIREFNSTSIGISIFKN